MGIAQLATLTDDTLICLGVVTLGRRKKLLAAAKRLECDAAVACNSGLSGNHDEASSQQLPAGAPTTGRCAAPGQDKSAAPGQVLSSAAASADSAARLPLQELPSGAPTTGEFANSGQVPSSAAGSADSATRPPLQELPSLLAPMQDQQLQHRQPWQQAGQACEEGRPQMRSSGDTGGTKRHITDFFEPPGGRRTPVQQPLQGGKNLSPAAIYLLLCSASSARNSPNLSGTVPAESSDSDCFSHPPTSENRSGSQPALVRMSSICGEKEVSWCKEIDLLLMRRPGCTA